MSGRATPPKGVPSSAPPLHGCSEDPGPSSRQDSFQSTYPSLSSHGLVNAVSLFASQGHICLATQHEDQKGYKRRQRTGWPTLHKGICSHANDPKQDGWREQAEGRASGANLFPQKMLTDFLRASSQPCPLQMKDPRGSAATGVTADTTEEAKRGAEP